MEFDDEWRWMGKKRYVLCRGDSIFVSVENILPNAVMGATITTCTEMGLVPFAYKGLVQLPEGKISNVHAPARSEFKQSKALFIILKSKPDLLAGNDWILGKIDDAVLRGVIVSMYIIRERLGVEENFASLWPTINTRPIDSVEYFGRIFRQDILTLMKAPV